MEVTLDVEALLLLKNELLEALKAVYNLIDKGFLVRDISKDSDFEYFIKQSIEINNAIVLMNEAIRKAAE